MISIFLKMSKNLENCSSLLAFLSLCGNGTEGVLAGMPSFCFCSLLPYEIGSSSNSRIDEVKAIITLRSGKEIEQPMPMIAQETEKRKGK